MKKHAPKLVPQLIPRRKKEMEKLVQNPEAVKRIIEMNKSAAEVLEKQKTLKTTSLKEWEERCLLILPDIYQNDDFVNKFKEFVDANRQPIETELAKPGENP